MDELAKRRKLLFSGANFSSAIIHSGDSAASQSANFAYFAGFWLDGCYLILKKGGGTVIAHRMNEAEARRLSSYPVRRFLEKPLQQVRRLCGRGKVGFCASELPAKRFLALRKAAGLRLVDAGDKMLAVRSAKSAGELRALAASAALARRILGRLNPWKFRSERELARHLCMLAVENGAEVSFPPIVATDGNASHPHHSPTGRRLGGMVLVDFGVRLGGYCSDFTRCYFRKKGSKEEKAYRKCVLAFRKIAGALAKCRTGGDVAALSEKALAEQGLPKMIHSIGHGIGLDVHEKPLLSRGSKDSISGAVMAIEPAAYFRRFGVRYEEMVAFKGGRWAKI
jgi:Xaa-Pro aminopeptidase